MEALINEWNKPFPITIYDTAVKRLKESRENPAFLINLKAKKNIIDQIYYSMTLFDDEYLKAFNTVKENKNILYSVDNRKKGNIGMIFQLYEKSMSFYNRGIVYCPSSTEELSLLYANRSVICLKWDMYEDCLKNIDLAMENYPVHLYEKLNTRKKFAEKELAKQRLEKIKPITEQLSYDANPDIPTVVNCLEYYNNKMITNQDLKPNDIIMIEPMFAHLTASVFDQCGYCLRTSYSTIACEHCDHTMFCDEKCRQAGYNSFHKYECGILCLLHNVEVDIVMGLRLAFVALTKFDLNELKEMFDSYCDRKNLNPFEEYKNDKNYDTATYKCIVNIKTPPIRNYPTDHDNFPTTYSDHHHDSALFAISFVLRHIGDRLPMSTKDDELFIFKFLYWHMEYTRNMIKNINPTLDYVINQKRLIDRTDGFAVHGLASFIKISCKPNLQMKYDDNKRLIVKVTKPIAKGDELLGSFK